MRQRETKFLIMVGGAMLTILLAAYMLTIIGVIDLKVISSIRWNGWIDECLNICMYLINIFLVILIVFASSNNRIKYAFGYVPICLILVVFGYSFNIASQWYYWTISTFAPIIYLVFISVFCAKKTRRIFIAILVFVLFGIFQRLTMTIKLHSMNLELIPYTPIVTFILSFDIYLISYIIYKVVKSCVSFPRKHSMVPFKSSPQIPAQSGGEDLQELSPKQEKLYLVLVVISQLIPTIGVIVVGYVFNLVVQVLIMIAVFFVGRALLGGGWHSNSILVCTSFAIGSFIILCRISLPWQVSLFWCVVLAASFAYAINKAGLYVNEHDIMSADKAKREAFKPDKATKDEMTERCRMIGLDTITTAFCLLAFVDHASGKELAEFSGIEPESAERKKTRLRKRLLSIK